MSPVAELVDAVRAGDAEAALVLLDWCAEHRIPREIAVALISMLHHGTALRVMDQTPMAIACEVTTGVGTSAPLSSVRTIARPRLAMMVSSVAININSTIDFGGFAIDRLVEISRSSVPVPPPPRTGAAAPARGGKPPSPTR